MIIVRRQGYLVLGSNPNILPAAAAAKSLQSVVSDSV